MVVTQAAQKFWLKLEPQERIGLSTSFLPRMRSTTELLGQGTTGGGGGIRTPEAMTQLIYSQSPLTTWVPHRACKL